MSDEMSYDDPDYQRFLSEMAKNCRCTHGICGGVLAGGLCDEIIDDVRRFDDDDDLGETSDYEN